MASKSKQTGRAKSSKPPTSEEMATLKKKIQTLSTEVSLLRNNFDRSKIPKDLITDLDLDSMYKEYYFLTLEELKKVKEEKGIGSDIDEMKEKYQKLQDELTEAHKKRKIAEEEVHLMTSRMSLLEEENKRLKNSTETTVKPSTPKEDNDLKEKLQQLTEDKDKLTKELTALREANADLKQKTAALQDAKDTISGDEGRLQDSNKKLTNELETNKKETTMLKEQLDAETKRVKEHLARAAELQDKLDDQSDKISNLEAERKKLKHQIESLKDEMASMTDTSDGDEQLRKTLEKRIDDVTRDYESQISDLRKELENKTAAMVEMKDGLAEKTNLETTIDNLNKEKTEQKEMIEKLQKETQSLQTRIQHLEESANTPRNGIDEDSSRLRTIIQELQKELETVKSERDNAKLDIKQHKNDLHDAFVQIDKKEKEMKTMENKHKELIERKEKTIDTLRREKSMVDTTGGKPTQEVQELKKRILSLQEENDALQSRVSQLAGAKLQDSNPGITNLSDENRPTKVGESFAQLYDNEWTEAFEEQEEATGDEKGTIEYLYKLLVEIYSFCQNMARKQAESVQRLCTSLTGKTGNNSKVPEIHLVQKKQLKDILKSFASFQINDLIQNFFETNKSSNSSGSKTKEFIHKAIEICWYMALQDPPMIIDKDRKSSDRLETDIFKVYTKKGDKIDFVVWPPLLLHKDGPLVGKGVAQGK